MRTAGQTLRIADGHEALTLTYAGALDFHDGASWFGVTVAFRMLQAAADVLSGDRLWNRGDLFVVSGHPGNGVRDAIEYVTRCVSAGRYQLDHADAGAGCGRGMRFRWEIGDGLRIAALHLRAGLVPDELFELLDRRASPRERRGDAARFAALKRELAERAWAEPLARLIHVDLLDAGVAGHA